MMNGQKVLTVLGKLIIIVMKLLLLLYYAIIMLFLRYVIFPLSHDLFSIHNPDIVEEVNYNCCYCYNYYCCYCYWTDFFGGQNEN